MRFSAGSPPPSRRLRIPPLWRWLPAFLLLAAASVSAASPRPNILVIISDDQRPDTIAALGNAHIQTPNLDRLVREGTALTRVIAAYPICHVSRVELLTGVSAFRHGFGEFAKRPDAPAAWPGVFRAAGYRTALVGKWDSGGLPSKMGFEKTRGLFSAGGGPKAGGSPYLDFRGQPATGYRGYTFKNATGAPEPEKGVGLTPGISARFADAAIELIREFHGEPFFIQLAFTTPHDPRLIPPGCEGRYDPAKIPLPVNFLPEHPFDHGNLGGRDEVLLPTPRPPGLIQEELAAYYATITYMDEQIGRILEALSAQGSLENTLVIFTSDQGLAIGSHGLLGKQNMYEHTLGVPLIVRGPGIPVGGRCEAQGYLRDLFPTTCELAGIAFPPELDGKSLLPCIVGGAASPYPFLVSYFTDTQRAIRTPEWKYIEYPKAKRRQLFHLRDDPTELHDLSVEPAQTEIAASLRRDLVKWLREHHDPLGLE